MDTRAPAVAAAPPPVRDARPAPPPAPEPLPLLDAAVTGPCNALAFQAARRFAEGVGGFETLLLTGPAGCGKTHLLRALYGAFLAGRRLASVLYVPADRFHQQYVCAVQRRLLDPFRRKYRTADVLLFDDVHRLATQPRTQEEFLHTFDALHHHGRRIALTAERPPQELEGLSRPLQVRLQSAIGFRLERPDEAARLAFLRARARAEGRAVPEAALAWLAAQPATSFGDLVRGLEAMQAGHGDPSGARDLLEELRRGGAAAVTVESIVRRVAGTLGVNPEGLRESRRTRTLVEGRRLCFYLGRRHTPLTLGALGRALGGRDHATVLQAIRQVEARRKADGAFDRLVAQLEEGLREERAAGGGVPDAPAPAARGAGA
jgi:chromosomal replication initiator protein